MVLLSQRTVQDPIQQRKGQPCQWNEERRDSTTRKNEANNSAQTMEQTRSNVPSVVLSQKQELEVWRPAPFLCMMTQVTDNTNERAAISYYQSP